MDSDFMNNLANAMKNGNIPDDIKNMINNLNNNNSNDNSNNDSNNSNGFDNFDNNTSNSTNSINPDMLKNIMNMFNNSSNNASNNSNNFNNTGNSNNSMPNFDINMFLKMKSVMDKMNSNKNDPRSNLLLSLKPYLKESRKSKVEQYVQLFNMTKVIDVFNQDTGGENLK